MMQALGEAREHLCVALALHTKIAGAGGVGGALTTVLHDQGMGQVTCRWL